MKIGQRVIYVDETIGNLKGIVVNKKTEDKAKVFFADDIYGKFQRTVHIKKLYKCRNEK